MNNKEEKEELWKRGKKRMKTKEGKDEPWKSRKVKSEKKGGRDDQGSGKGKTLEKHLKSERSELLRFFFEGLSFSIVLATPSSFFQVWPSLSSMVLPSPLYFRHTKFTQIDKIFKEEPIFRKSDPPEAAPLLDLCLKGTTKIHQN